MFEDEDKVTLNMFMSGEEQRKAPSMFDTLKSSVGMLEQDAIPAVSISAPAVQPDRVFDMNTFDTEQAQYNTTQDENMFTNNAPIRGQDTNVSKMFNDQAKEQLLAYTKQKEEDAVVEQQQNFTSSLIGSVFKGEGGYSTDTKDTGNYYRKKFVGTNHGISAPILAEYLGRTPTVDDMKSLTQEEASGIYQDKYYTKMGINELPQELQEITLHGVVNSGNHATKVIQGLMGLKKDGVVGPMTREAMSRATFTKQEFKDALLKKYKTFKTWKTHGKGWTNRFEGLAK